LLVVGLVVVLGMSACGDPDGEGGDDSPTSSASSSSSSSTSSPSSSDSPTDGPPPPPTTACLPETPVELDVGPFLRGCGITPFYWKVTNLSRTIVRLGPTPAATFADASQPESADPVEQILATLYTRYRQTYETGYFLQPGDTVAVSWSSGPGRLAYQASPAESVGYTVAVEAATGLAAKAKGTNAEKGLALEGCLVGVRDSLKDRLTGPDLPADQTWNTYVDNALTVSSCSDLLDEDTKKAARQKIQARVSPLWDDVKIGWAKRFLAIYPKG
jgi:hypothetical protein